MELKATKGPWKIWGDWAIKDCTPAENLIATFEHHDQDPGAGFANAHLIASAPDMYELLDRIAGGKGVWSIEEVEKLLSKAKGEDNND